MTLPRSSLVSVEDTPYYHCFGRCVRRAFLCGYDEKTQQSYEHRRLWISERLAVLTDTFAIDICAYAIMSNHYHLVVKLDPERTKSWSNREVIERWLALYKGTDAARRYLNNESLDDVEKRRLDADIQKWQARLSNLSWFMRCLNEYIAKRANKEDDCKGHFWESRFKSQALLDEVALLTSMTYVDLNPIRAKMAESVAVSDYTSVQDRFRDATNKSHTYPAEQRPRLLPFGEFERGDAIDYLPFNLKDYLDLVDSTGRVMVAGKRGFIDDRVPKLIRSLSINETQWLRCAAGAQKRFELALGMPARLQQLAERWGNQWIQGIGLARRLYSQSIE